MGIWEYGNMGNHKNIHDILREKHDILREKHDILRETPKANICVYR